MKKKFNIIDLVIVLVIVAVTAAVIMIMGIKDKTEQTQPKTVVVEVRQRSENFCNTPQEGDIIINATTKEEIGTLLKKEVVPATNIVSSVEDGTFVNAEIPEYYDLYLTISIHSDTDIAKIGKSLYVQSHNYACTGFIVDVPENEEVQK